METGVKASSLREPGIIFCLNPHFQRGPWIPAFAGMKIINFHDHRGIVAIHAMRRALCAMRFSGVQMDRKDIERGLISVRRGSFGKPDLFQVKMGEATLMVKDVRGKSFFSRWTVGLWLIQKEWKIYSRLGGVKHIPRPVERIDRFAFAMEFVPATPISRGEKISPAFFSGLERILRDIHSRGVVHLDLRHKGNILVSEQGEPILIDFNSSFLFREGGLLRRALFPVLKWVDHGGLLKLKQRVCPSSMTPEETSSLKRFNRLRRLWIFN